MGEYFGLFWKGVFTGMFWKERWETLRELLKKPTGFFEGSKTSGWSERVVLMGMAASFFFIVLHMVLTSGFFALFLGPAGILAIPVAVVAGVALWFLGVLFLYYVIAGINALAAKWVASEGDVEKIRPIVFASTVGAPLGLVPGGGSLLGVIVSGVLLVIGYEKGLKVTRSQAVGITLVSLLICGLLVGLISFGIGSLVTMAFMAGS